MRDGRFHPIELREIPSLECKVSLLCRYEFADNYLDWEVGIHGLIIEFTDVSRTSVKRSATYLPDIARQEGWTKVGRCRLTPVFAIDPTLAFSS